MKIIKCKECGKEFVKKKPGNFCNPLCAKIHSNKKAYMKRKAKEKTIKPKVKLKKVQVLLREFEKVFNEYIRLRDKDKPCISCGEYKELQAGHYFAVSGYKALRFDEDNVNGECAGCNCFNESHLIGYGINLQIKIGHVDYRDLIRRAENYKRDRYQNEYYSGGKWDREGLIKGIQFYKQKVAEFK